MQLEHDLIHEVFNFEALRPLDEHGPIMSVAFGCRSILQHGLMPDIDLHLERSRRHLATSTTALGQLQNDIEMCKFLKNLLRERDNTPEHSPTQT